MKWFLYMCYILLFKHNLLFLDFLIINFYGPYFYKSLFGSCMCVENVSSLCKGQWNSYILHEGSVEKSTQFIWNNLLDDQRR